jgi:hypothetical protein
MQPANYFPDVAIRQNSLGGTAYEQKCHRWNSCRCDRRARRLDVHAGVERTDHDGPGTGHAASFEHGNTASLAGSSDA